MCSSLKFNNSSLNLKYGIHMYFEGVLDEGETLRKVISMKKQSMSRNFEATLLVLGGLGLAVHYEQLSIPYDGIPLVMAYGEPVSGKLHAVEFAMAVIGQFDRIGGI